MNLYFIGGFLILKGYLEIGTLLVFMNYYAILFTNIESITGSIVGLKSDQESIDRIKEILTYQKNRKIDVDIIGSDLLFKDVCFKYTSQNFNSISNMSMEIPALSNVALVGKSGSGKTTIAKLISGIIYPQSGEIMLGGYNIASLSTKSIGKKIAVVMQRPFLFNFSIKDNLLLAKRNANFCELEEACRQACILDYIYSLPEKFDSIIGERGVKLSGGQMQRIAIARAILMDVDILVLDESTAALDYENETNIMNSLEKFIGEKTIISISHRFSTIIRAEKTIVLNDGKIEAYGLTEEIISCKKYKEQF